MRKACPHFLLDCPTLHQTAGVTVCENFAGSCPCRWPAEGFNNGVPLPRNRVHFLQTWLMFLLTAMPFKKPLASLPNLPALRRSRPLRRMRFRSTVGHEGQSVRREQSPRMLPSEVMTRKRQATECDQRAAAAKLSVRNSTVCELLSWNPAI